VRQSQYAKADRGGVVARIIFGFYRSERKLDKNDKGLINRRGPGNGWHQQREEQMDADGNNARPYRWTIRFDDDAWGV